MIRLSMKIEDGRPTWFPKTSPLGEMPKGRGGQQNKQKPTAFTGLRTESFGLLKKAEDEQAEGSSK
nr:hypothetical protein [uncultured Carboxylicivirga sp.]